MFQVAGGSVGLGLTTTVFTTASEDKLQRAPPGCSESEIEDVQGVLAGTESAAAGARARQGKAAAERLVETGARGVRRRADLVVPAGGAAGAGRPGGVDPVRGRLAARAAAASLRLSRIQQTERQLRESRGCGRASRCRARPAGSTVVPPRVSQRRAISRGRLAGQARGGLSRGAERHQLLGVGHLHRAAGQARHGRPARRARAPRRRSAPPERRGRARSRPSRAARAPRRATRPLPRRRRAGSARASVSWRRPAIVPAARGRLGVRSPSR